MAAVMGVAMVGGSTVAQATEVSGGRVAPVAWAACEGAEEFDCAAYQVPLDHAKKDGAKVTLALARRPADDQAHKLGTIFVNPGGPGGSGVEIVPGAAVLFGKDVVKRFDIVGVDPRGVGASSPVQCFPTDEAAEKVLSGLVSVPLRRAEIRSTTVAARAYGKACAQNAGPILRHMSTLDVVKDFDLLRQAVGDRKFNFYGLSYGTFIGAIYANVFPDKVGAMVLDGNVDPDRRANDRLNNKLERSKYGFEKTLSGFLAECDAAGAKCAFSTGDPRRKFDALRERLRRGPVTLPDDLGTVTISTFTDQIAGALYNPTDYRELALGLEGLFTVVAAEKAATSVVRKAARTARAGRSPVPSSGETAQGARAGRAFRVGVDRPVAADAYSYNSPDSLLAVNCVDSPLPRHPEVYPLVARTFEKVSPTFGRLEAFSELPCATWPVRGDRRYRGPWDNKTAAPILVVNPTFDPATPYLFGQRMTRQLASARLLTVDGFGHTAAVGSSCATGHRARYFLTGALPPVNTRCGQDARPFDLAPPATTAAATSSELTWLTSRLGVRPGTLR